MFPPTKSTLNYEFQHSTLEIFRHYATKIEILRQEFENTSPACKNYFGKISKFLRQDFKISSAGF